MQSVWPIDVSALNAGADDAPTASAGAVVWRFGGALQVTVVVKATFALVHGGAAAPVAPGQLVRRDQHHDRDPSRSVRAAGDLAPFRPRVDVTVVGHAYAPAGRPVTTAAARLAIFGATPLLDKTLHVYGDRGPAPGGAAIPPPIRPFQRMPLAYERAERGPENPAGLDPRVRAPNVVDPLSAEGGAERAPAGFAPIARRWPSRKRLLGRLDRLLVEADIADLPEGFDFGYFQAAPLDQQLEVLGGDEWIVLDGMHPAMPRVQSQLPSARGLARVYQTGASGTPEASWLDLALDALAVDADAQTCDLVWRGCFAVEDEAALGRLQVLVGVELPDRALRWPEPEELYRAPFEEVEEDGTGVGTGVSAWGKAESTALITPAALRPPGRGAAAREEEGTAVIALPPGEAARLAGALPFATGPESAPRGRLPFASDPEARALPAGFAAAAHGVVAVGPDGETLQLPPAPPPPSGLPFGRAAREAPRPPAATGPDGVTLTLPPAPPPPGGLPFAGSEREEHTSFLSLADHEGHGQQAAIPFAAAAPEGPPASFGPRGYVPAEPAEEPGAPPPEAPSPAARTGPIPERTTPGIPVINGTPLVLVTLPWQVRPPQDSLTVFVKGSFELVADGPARLRPETTPPNGDVHLDEDLGRSIRQASDFAVFKPRADVTLVGHAFAPGGSSPAMQVGFRFGAGAHRFERWIAVFGDRTWTRAVVTLAPTDPQPFERMPLVYERAFGGPGFERNPCGTGHKSAAAPGVTLRLPNLEDPARVISGPGDAPLPACFAPIPVLWKERWSRLGSYDARWLRTRWPYFPEDFDWGYFQAAPAAQQLPYLTGDEPFEITGMVAGAPVLRGSLPGVRVRCFAQYAASAPGGAALPAGATPGALQEVALRLDTAAFDTDDGAVHLVWRGVLDVSEEEAPEIALLFVLAEELAAAPATLEEARGKLHAALAPLAPIEESPGGSPEAANDTAEQDDEDAARVEADAAAFEERLRGELRAAGFADDAVEPPVPPPAPTAAAMAASMREAGASDEEVAGMLEALKPPEEDAGDEPAPPPPDLRPRVIARLAAGEAFDGLDLGGADLAGLDFEGRSLAGANLKDARLAGCRLVRANLTGAQLGGADLTDAVLDEAELAGADLHGARLEGASLVGAHLDAADFTLATAPRACFRAATGAGPIFEKATLTGASFEEARLAGADFTGAALDGAVFDRADLPEVRLYGAHGVGARFEHAKLPGARADGARLHGCSLRHLEAPGSEWEKADLEGSTFYGANLRGAGFSRARCSQTVLSGADLTEARFRRASLAGAQLLKANLMMATLERADLTGADLRGANLHGAETWRATLDHARLDLAIVTRSKLKRPA